MKHTMVCSLLAVLLVSTVIAAPPSLEVVTEPTGQQTVVRPKQPIRPYRLGYLAPYLVLSVNNTNPALPPDIYFIPITIGGPAPGPTPNPSPRPDPRPDPKPVPVPTVLWGIVVEETKERTPAQAAVLLNPKVDILFKPAGQFRLVDPWDDAGNLKTDIEPAMKPYAERATALKVKPCLFIVDPKGTVYSEGPLPATVADVEALVARIRKGDKS